MFLALSAIRFLRFSIMIIFHFCHFSFPKFFLNNAWYMVVTKSWTSVWPPIVFSFPPQFFPVKKTTGNIVLVGNIPGQQFYRLSETLSWPGEHTNNCQMYTKHTLASLLSQILKMFFFFTKSQYVIYRSRTVKKYIVTEVG